MTFDEWLDTASTKDADIILGDVVVGTKVWTSLLKLVRAQRRRIEQLGEALEMNPASDEIAKLEAALMGKD